MLFSAGWKFSSSRKRNSRLILSIADRLEVGSLLSSTAAILWQMDPRIAPDPARGDEPDLPNTRTYVNPARLRADARRVAIERDFAGLDVLLDGHRLGHRVIHLTGEHVALSLPQGKYKVKLQASGLAGTLNPTTTSTKIQVKDVLIVSIGDSFASGEGDPVVPANDSSDGRRWAYSPDPAMDQQNADAHRSTISGPAGFALALQEEDPHEAVTFVSVANSDG